jgi:hypothetical protein
MTCREELRKVTMWLAHWGNIQYMKLSTAIIGLGGDILLMVGVSGSGWRPRK